MNNEPLNEEALEQGANDNPYENKSEISQRITRVLETDAWSHQLFESAWFRNILMIAGAQWIIKDRNGRWQRKSVPFLGFPRTYTNKVAEKYNDLVSQLVQGKRIPISCQPSDPDDQADRATAEIGEDLVDVIRTEICEDEKQHEIASWLVATGNCFGIPNYDMSEDAGTVQVNLQQCLDCGYGPIKPAELAESGATCPECGSNNLAPAVDPDDAGQFVEDMPRGCLSMDVAPPFEIRLDHRVQHYKQLRRFVRQKRYDLDYAKERWGAEVGANNIVADTGDTDPGNYYLDVLANVTSAYRYGAGLFSNSANGSNKTPKVTVYHFYELPTAEFPQGVKSLRIGSSADCIAEAGPLTTEYGAGVRKGKKFLPLVHWGYSKVPGRFWYKTPIDDAVPLQITRNVVEANINITVQRMGNPVWFNPKGSGVETFTGESGQVINYNPIAVGGTTPVKPERVPAELNNLAPLIAWMTRIDDAIERVTGTFFLAGGDSPPGVTAASALAYLGEKGQQSLSALRAGWSESWRQVYLYALEIARANWDEDRIAVIGGQNSQWKAQKFTKADIQGAVNMVIDYNSLAPKSMATEQAKIQVLVQMGMVNPMDDATRVEVLKEFGALHLLGQVNLDIEYAGKMWDRFKSDTTFMPQVRPLIDNSTILLLEANKYAKMDEYDALPPERQQMWLEYCKMLAFDIAARRAMLGANGIDPDSPASSELTSGDAAAMGGGAAGAPPAPGGQADPNGAPVPPDQGPLPDIGGVPEDFGSLPPEVTPEGSPRSIPLPPNG